MNRCIRREATSRLRELPFAARAVVALGVEPGNGHVDEALEEVALLGRRVPPLVLELLVRLEVGAGSDEYEARLEAHALVTRRSYPATIDIRGEC